MEVKHLSLIMSDGCEIFINRWVPDENTQIKGLVQLHHGLAEYSMRYDNLGKVLAENGYILNAYDFRGHGKTAEKQIENKTGCFGKIADKDGFNRAVEDLNEIITHFKNDYPNKEIVLIGHSCGSFISQGFIEKYASKIDGCILIGTAGPRVAYATFGNIIANIVKFFKGPNSIVKFLEKASFGSYNKRVSNPTSPNAWISKSEKNLEAYENDKWCGFKLTTSFFCDVTYGLKTIHKTKNIEKIPLYLPVYFLYGSEDPVGDYGKTINKLYDIYLERGMGDVSIKAYDGYRHEILNEEIREEVEQDILNWISDRIG